MVGRERPDEGVLTVAGVLVTALVLDNAGPVGNARGGGGRRKLR